MQTADKSMEDAPEAVAAMTTGGRGYWSLLVAIACVAVTAFGVYRLLGAGPFEWHVAQPQFAEGMIEFLALWGIGFVLLVSLAGWVRLAALGALLMLYMRMHGTDLALLLGVAYCLGIYGLGLAVITPAQLPDVSGDYRFRAHALRSALGLSIMALFLMLGALVFKWDFESNRVAGLAMAGIGLFFLIRQMFGSIRSVSDPLSGTDWVTKSALSLLAATAMVCIARSNLPFYFDSAWYGLRPDRVLLGANGFYESLGLTTQVHYYPKLYELVIAPLQGMGDVSNVIVVGVMGASLLVLAVVSFAAVFKGRTSYGLVHAALLVCYPAVMGTVETPKGDVLAASFVVFAFIALCRAFETKSPAMLVDVAMYCLVASTLRLSALPWLGILFICWLFAMGVLFVSQERGKPWQHRFLVPLFLVFAAFLLTHARTYWLAGVPVITNSDLQAQLAKFGFQLREPVGSLTGSGTARFGLPEGLVVLFELGLQPDRYPLHVFKWIGASWLVYLLVIFVRPDRAFRGWRGRIALAGIILFPLLVAFNSWAAGAPGGDGNYFIVSVAMIYVCGIAAIRKFHSLALTLLLACAGVGTAIYIMGANWEVGTGSVSRSFDKSPFDESKQVGAYLATSGLEGFANRIGVCGRDTHMIGELRTPGSYLLPVVFEPFEELAWNNVKAFGTPEGLQKLLRSTGTDLVGLPVAGTGKVPEGRVEMVEYVRTQLAGNGPLAAMAKATVDGVDLYATSPEGVSCIQIIATGGTVR